MLQEIKTMIIKKREYFFISTRQWLNTAWPESQSMSFGACLCLKKSISFYKYKQERDSFLAKYLTEGYLTSHSVTKKSIIVIIPNIYNIIRYSTAGLNLIIDPTTQA
jgi:hypothetical protein